MKIISLYMEYCCDIESVSSFLNWSVSLDDELTVHSAVGQ
jgi:hypothetical protein